MNITIKKYRAVFYCFILFLGCFCIFGCKKQSNNFAVITDSKQLVDRKVGMQTCTAGECPFMENYPGVILNYYTAPSDLILALRTGKIDAFFIENIVAKIILNKNKDLTVLSDKVEEFQCAFALSKNNPLTPKLKRAFEKLKKEGAIDHIIELWAGTDESRKVMPIQDWPAVNGTIRYVTDDTSEPIAYLGHGGQVIGIEPHIMLLLCKELSMRLEITNMVYEACIPCIQSGKADVAGGDIPYYDSYREVMDMIPNFNNGMRLIIRKSDYANDSELTESDVFQIIKNSFYNNLIMEDRWKLLISGLKKTFFITFWSCWIGIILGIVLCWLRCCCGGFILEATNMWIGLVLGIPDVIFLMLMFYVVFNKLVISPEFAAITTFSIILSAYSSDIFKSGIESVQQGQLEAAIALGYKPYQGFIKIILPQAIVFFLPALRGAIINLLKNTSIVGYVAIQDLTKISDAIRARTLDPFFPLVITAIIYFVMSYMIIKLTDVILAKFSRKCSLCSMV